MSTQDASLAPGFADPVRDAGRCFRALMQAMARPGSLQTWTNPKLAPPPPLSPALAAAILTLTDYDTPVWLDTDLAADPAVAGYLRFHAGAPIVANPSEAAFALIGNLPALPALGQFHQGTLEYPDRSTTLILAVETVLGGTPVHLEGPGIKTFQTIAPRPLPPHFWSQMQTNNAQFPRGVDVIFASPEGFAAVPRSTRIILQEA